MRHGGQDAFVDQKTNVASYYWDKMNAGVGRYPHHAWWQVGWIVDYLLSEIALRSNGNIVFPRGFITPKVGPHQTYGFASGKIYGGRAELLLKEGLVSMDNPRIEYMGAINQSSKEGYLMFLNNSVDRQRVHVNVNYEILFGKKETVNKIQLLDEKGNIVREISVGDSLVLETPAFGLNTLKITY